MGNQSLTVRADSVEMATAIQQENGTIVRITRPVKLSIADGTLTKLPMKEEVNGQWLPVVIPSAKGFMQMAGDAGIVVHHPDTVVIDGKEVPNGSTDAFGRAYFRAMAIGYSSTGQPAITDRTIVYDATTYMVADLLAKARSKKNPEYQAMFRIMPRQVNDKGALVGAPPTTDNHEVWAPYALDNSATLWLDVSRPVVFEWYSEMKNREKTSIRTAQTFADRNAISAHPGLPPQRKFHTDTAVVKVTTWYANKGICRFDRSLITVDPTKLLGAPQSEVIMDVKAEPEDVAADPDAVRAESASDPTDPAEVREPSPDEDDIQDAGAKGAAAQDTPKEDVQKTELLANIKRLKGTRPPSVFKRVTTELGMAISKDADLDSLDIPKLVAILAALQK
jgi:hypothetical protein